MKTGIGLTSTASACAAHAMHLLAAASLLAAANPVLAQSSPPDSLESGFRTPPPEARPRVWWHWLGGNISKEGIQQDLEWMRRAGIGGAQMFDASLATPQIVDKPVLFMSSEWKDAFHYAAGLADRLGIELAIASSPGFSETGGPWVAPADGMKKLVWSETLASGDPGQAIRLPLPPDIVGPFQTMAPAGQVGRSAVPPAPFYTDAAVVAWPLTEAASLPAPQVSISGAPVDYALLSDGQYKDSVRVEVATANQPGGVVASFETPQTIRSVTMHIPGKSALIDVPIAPRLEASTDGTNWTTVASIPVSPVPTTVSFAPVTARQFRLLLAPAPSNSVSFGAPAPGVVGADRFVGMASAQKSARLTEFRLSAEARVDRFEAKAGFAVERDYYALRTSDRPETPGIAPARVIDLTGRMRGDGTLDWTPPPGKWRILRLGYSLLGTNNHPARPEATGLEVDKMDGAAVRRYLDTYLGMYRDAAGTDLVGSRGVRAMLNDSIESGAMNWTPRMIEQFRRLRGYDPTPWLPALTGAIVGSRGASDAFLFDFRRTIADLLASEHYGTIARVAHENGLKVYGEALESERVMLGDDMAMRSHADVPMAAMWTYAREAGPKPTYIADIRGAASVAHLYGQNIVAAESLTSALAPWAFGPGDLRRVIDLEFATGVNLPVIHTSVHQPLVGKAPGLRFFIFGQDFTRNESWAEMARAWTDYVARSSFLLQQGRSFADVLYFHGEEAPLTGLFSDELVPDAPTRHAFDFANADVVLNLLSVERGELATKSGARYMLLYLGGSSGHMTLPVLRRIAKLAAAGATIAGEAPISSPGLGDDKAEFDRLVRKLWSGRPITRVGAGKVLATRDVEGALAQLGVGPDFSFAAPDTDSEVLFQHRRLADGDLYFLSNRKDRPQQFEARFRVTGKAPEIWRADTGSMEPLSWRMEGQETVVPLDMEADESFFVVFRKPAAARSGTIAKTVPTPIATIAGPWNIRFEAGRGAPDTITLPALASLSENAEPGVRYFSGIATYTTRFDLPADVRQGAPVTLNLGRVGDLAEVRINGQLVGTSWHEPYRIDIGQAVRTGANMLEIRVANLWVNRLIGDAQPGASKVGFTDSPTYKPDAPLRPSGLIGPVTLELAQ